MPGGVRSAFSLVETVLALAVMGLAVSVLLGLLPHGLDMARKAGVAAGDARITSDILAELSQVTWADVPAYDNRLFYFNDQGVRQDRADSTTAYVARVQLPSNVLLPGATVSMSEALRRVVIQIAATPNSNYKFETPGATYSTYVSIISRTND